MHTHTHLILGWLVGHRLEDRRDRVLVAWAGALPDLDALPILAGQDAYERLHHTFGHSLASGVVFVGAAALLARRRLATALLVALAFHLHLACDYIGGDQWPVFYFWPWSSEGYFAGWGWSLGSWQNVLITATALAWCVRIAAVRGRTLLEAIAPASADAAVVATLRRRFGRTAPEPAAPAAE